ncbi:MAG: hypothetical protein UU08_C0002G0031 [Candidatus Uhrbacteria bacterium GW2011_GWE2_40_58]|nr:MAG: hypothetical protein UT94_C0003G0015 [Candidatus Uhrbacteria bacterium GW2011_GWF2_40_263]KKR68180.1 MAG: hypothetical protein UU08_C0002G0031 [Candidatus Uhrbacteria bacterium GW2011_GWE2_40_58]OGL91867.1 MAG: hypothetical protein A2239_01605 [Candidatus Uhrbacteria bacterium RIFOXYA2_FULL_40_9]OGL97665.1 MAG: hypothetical protein A2332_00745 [Candidatus Uhrbacteria bacterium RIFOXYB2_FULL_41_18]HBK34655.1 hypothetical protein [Candidatus Uhrbacteria bacterium]
MNKPLFPILLKVDGTEKPPAGALFWYEIGCNGIFIGKNSGIISSLSRVSEGGIPFLKPVVAYADLAVNLLPIEQLAMMLNFFREIDRRMQTEVNVLLFYHPENDEWMIYCPEQEVTHGSVHYDNDIAFDGWLKIGTSHSHGNFGAFHSRTDHHDESQLDGLHMVVSQVSCDTPEIDLIMMVNGQSFKKDVAEYLAGACLTEVSIPYMRSIPPKKKFSKGREARVATTPVYPSPISPPDLTSGFTKQILNALLRPIQTVPSTCRSGDMVREIEPLVPLPPPVQTTDYRKESRVVLQLPPGKRITDYPFPQEWLARVKRKTYPVVQPVRQDVSVTTIPFASTTPRLSLSDAETRDDLPLYERFDLETPDDLMQTPRFDPFLPHRRKP